jgi:hypothetical protein
MVDHARHDQVIEQFSVSPNIYLPDIDIPTSTSVQYKELHNLGHFARLKETHRPSYSVNCSRQIMLAILFHPQCRRYRTENMRKAPDGNRNRIYQDGSARPCSRNRRNMMSCDCGHSSKLLTTGRDVYRVEKALVTTRLRASSFFFRSSAGASSISSWAMASLRADSIFSFWPRFNLMEVMGSETISSTREM